MRYTQHARLRSFSLRLAAAATLIAVAVSCAAPKPLRIGFIGTQSGSASELGVSGRRGVELAVKLWNDRGGIRGRPIELVLFDDRNDPALVERAVAEFKADGVVAAIGPMTSNIGLALAEKSNPAELIVLSPTVSASSLFGLDDFFFILVPSNVEDGIHLAELAARRGFGRVVVVGDKTNAQYVSVYTEAFSRRFSGLGGEVLPFVAYDPKSRHAAGATAEAALAGGPDCIVFITGAADTAALVQAISIRSPDMSFLTNPWSMTVDLIAGTGSFGKNLVIQSLYDPGDPHPAFAAFLTRYRDFFATEPSFGAVFAYEAAAALFGALESTRDHGPRSLKAALLEREVTGGCGAPFRFTPTGESGKPLYAFTIAEGRFKRLE